ncbi:MAG: DTW domain-containing protein, partial [Betaproteobacteria bacterium]|nr:DTW domain-containing protein [Betaproteobacteria bacterium]
RTAGPISTTSPANSTPGIAAATRVRLPSGQKPSEFQLRREPNPEAVCTIEAVARALGVLERERGAEVQAALEKLLRTMVQRTLLARGLLSAEQAAPWLS